MYIPKPEEALLVSRAKLGDTDAFSQLTKNCYDKIRGYLASQHDLFSEHEDITQDAFLEAFENIGSFKGLSLFSTWVKGIAYNLVKYRRRKIRRSVSLVPYWDNLSDNLSRFDKDPIKDLEYEELQAQLGRFINTLPPREKLVFSLKVLDADSYQSICRQTRQNLNACRKTFRRARDKWKRFLQAELNGTYEESILNKED